MHRSTAAKSRCSEHDAIIHSGLTDLSRQLRPSLERATGEGAAVLLCLDEPTAARIRTELGSMCDAFTFAPAASRYATPGIAMAALDKFVAHALACGAPAAWSIGSIPLAADGQDRRWMRYEEAVEHIFADRPLRAVCLYDAATTPLHLRRDVERNHDHTSGKWTEDPHDFIREASELRPSRPPDVELFNPASRDVRAAIEALLAVVPEDAVDDVRFVASELVTNANVHGVAPISCRIWIDGSKCIVQVDDSGSAPIDPYADLRPCVGGAHGGFGLPMSGQLAEAVSIQQDFSGTKVTAVLNLQHWVV